MTKKLTFLISFLYVWAGPAEGDFQGEGGGHDDKLFTHVIGKIPPVRYNN
jgi:hypothetical protein